MSAPRIDIEDGLVRIGDRLVPLIAGEIQFWRMDPDQWAPAVSAARDAGITIISTYLSWRRHEPEQGVLDFTGRTDPRLDVRRFLDICRELDVFVQLKPGPWICAEEPGGGYPDWLLAQEELLARDDQGAVVIGYNPPFLHHVPSYADERFLEIVRGWFAAVWEVIGDDVHPHGPVVALQLDNEPSSSFQDAMYAADYSDGSVRGFRGWLDARYAGAEDEFRAAWEDQDATFSTARPPVRPGGAGGGSPRARLHDWIAYKTDATAEYLATLKRMHLDLGGEALLYTVNLVTHPVHDVPVAHAAVREIVGAVTGEDHYYIPPLDVADIHRLARSVSTARAAGEPLPWIPELQAGIWRSPGEVVEYPDPTPLEQEIWWGAAFALGFAGANLYMLVDRENWEHSPLTADGIASPFFRPVEGVVAAEAERPGLLGLPIRPPVVVAWHRPDAYDAYAVIGTSREPDVPWHDEHAAAAYRSWDATLAKLTELGIAYDLWDTSTALDAGSGAGSGAGTDVPVIVPDHSGVHSELVAEIRAAGRTVITAGPETGWAQLTEAALALPAVVGTDGPVPSTIVTTRAGGPASTEQVIHIVHWGDGDPAARLRIPGGRTGRLRNLRDGTTLDLADHETSLPLTPGHHVFVFSTS